MAKSQNDSGSLAGKTVRPGLLMYSSYHSDRHPDHVSMNPQTAAAAPPKPVIQGPKHHLGRILVSLILVFGIVFWLSHRHAADTPVNDQNTSTHQQGQSGQTATVTPPASTACAGNTLAKFITVSVSQRHMWACQGTKQLYDTAVVTGYQSDPADTTPLGTYTIFTKEANVHLTGSDSKGSWDDPVSYWMPFLFNQYGAYGFHDATWRKNTDFGNISPQSPDASHGCVELPLAAAKWLYNWSDVGTTLTIKS